MNFYIGNSAEDIAVTDRNAAFSDELQNYFYKLRNDIDYDMSVLYGIDPYADVTIFQEDVAELVAICEYVLKEDLLEGYREKEEGILEICRLMEMAQEALETGKGLVSLGD